MVPRSVPPPPQEDNRHGVKLYYIYNCMSNYNVYTSPENDTQVTTKIIKVTYKYKVT